MAAVGPATVPVVGTVMSGLLPRTVRARPGPGRRSGSRAAPPGTPTVAPGPAGHSWTGVLPQTSCTSGQRAAKGRPRPSAAGSGGSPGSPAGAMREAGSPMVGKARESARVYGYPGSSRSFREGPDSTSSPAYITAFSEVRGSDGAYRRTMSAVLVCSPMTPPSCAPAGRTRACGSTAASPTSQPHSSPPQPGKTACAAHSWSWGSVTPGPLAVLPLTGQSVRLTGPSQWLRMRPPWQSLSYD